MIISFNKEWVKAIKMWIIIYNNNSNQRNLLKKMGVISKNHTEILWKLHKITKANKCQIIFKIKKMMKIIITKIWEKELMI